MACFGVGLPTVLGTIQRDTLGGPATIGPLFTDTGGVIERLASVETWPYGHLLTDDGFTLATDDGFELVFSTGGQHRVEVLGGIQFTTPVPVDWGESLQVDTSHDMQVEFAGTLQNRVRALVEALTAQQAHASAPTDRLGAVAAALPWPAEWQGALVAAAASQPVEIIGGVQARTAASVTVDLTLAQATANPADFMGSLARFGSIPVELVGSITIRTTLLVNFSGPALIAHAILQASKVAISLTGEKAAIVLTGEVDG